MSKAVDHETCSRCSTKTDDYFYVFEPVAHFLCVDCFNLLYPPFIPVLEVPQITISEHINKLGRLL